MGVVRLRTTTARHQAANALRIAAGLGHIRGDQRTAYVEAKIEPAISARYLEEEKK
jgi:hypothetical protein